MRNSRGQVVLVVVLVMVVALTIGLSLVARTTTDIKITRQQEESARAFSAAEAGIEEALRTGQGFVAGPEIFSGASVNTIIKEATGYSEFLFSAEIPAGETATLWLNGHDGTGKLLEDPATDYSSNRFDLCWNGEAMGVTVFYKDGGEYKVNRGAYDPNQGRGNGFDNVDSGGCLNLAHKKTINLPSGTLLFARFKPYYAAAKIGALASGAPLPSQGQEIESTGSLGTITRKVKVVRAWPGPPVVFDYGLFSGGNLAK